MFRPFFNVLALGKLTVLLFHKVPVAKSPLETAELNLEGFEKVLLLVQRFFRVLPLEQALLALRAGNLPPRAACITFDDGYPDWLRGAVPMLENHNVHATFFITTGQLSTGLPMWNERILHAVAHAPAGMAPLEFPGSSLPLLSFDSVAERQMAIKQLDQFLKYQEPASKEHFLQVLERHTGAQIDQVPRMTPAELRELHARGFGIGGHAVTHPILSRCTPEQAYAEIGEARETLESLIHGKVTAFAYPNGVPMRDFGPEHVDMVRRAGYTSAVTTHRGAATAQTSLFQIPRFTPWGPSNAKMYLQTMRNLMQRPIELQDEAGGSGKRALMVAFHFPPQAGSSGIQRTLNFVKHLPKSGWQSSLLTVHPRAYVEQRNDQVASIPQQTRLIRAQALDAAKHLSLFGKYPSLLALPDRWSSWWLPAVWAGMREIRRQRPALIWSTYPISTAHLIGGTLSRLSGLPWVADFRDPMVSEGYPSHPLQRWMWKRLEARVMRGAARCIFTTERAAQAYRVRYPDAAHKCTVIENGYDEEAFEGNQARRPEVADDQLLLLHSGIIYPKDRDPTAFFSAIASLVDAGKISRKKLKIRFRAPQHENEVAALVDRHGLQDMVDIVPPIPYRDAIAEMLGADLLLVFQGNNFNTQIPAKMYEYLRAGRCIMGLVDPTGDTAAQLRKFKAVELVDIQSPQEIAKGLQRWMESLESSLTRQALMANVRDIQIYSRQAQALSLSESLNSVSKTTA